MVDPRAPGGERHPDVLDSGPPRRRSRWWAAAAVALLAAGLLAHPWQRGQDLRLGPVRLQADGSLVVPVVSRGSAVRLSDVALRAEGLTATTPAALADEVAAADARGAPPVHDPDRLLPKGDSTVVLGVRAACPDRPYPSGQVRVVLERAGERRTLVAPLPEGVRAQLRCAPLTLRAGVTPVAPGPGQVGLLLTAHVGEPQDGGRFERLAWPGYRVSGVGGVVPLSLGWAGADTNVVFGAVVSADCTQAAGDGLTAVFADRALPVPVTGAAVAAARALRAACP